jgi:hypothetical protein
MEFEPLLYIIPFRVVKGKSGNKEGSKSPPYYCMDW